MGDPADEVRGSPSPLPSSQDGPSRDEASMEMPSESDEASVPSESNERIELTSNESGGPGEDLPQNVDEKESAAIPRLARSGLPP